jgi:tetratricopeptide (TPR) repeat protein
MIGRRRRGWFRRLLPWALTAALAGTAGIGLVRTLGAGDPVKAAETLRKGDQAAGRRGDPIAALELLERVLADEPDNVPALFEMARAWQELRAWDNAIETLQRASDASTGIRDKVQAKAMAMSLLATADRYDDAVAVGQDIVALQPEDPVHRLRLGPVYLKGSLSAQSEMLLHFTDPAEKGMDDLRVERQVEAFVTDLWSDADAAALVVRLTPGADSVLRQQITARLEAARLRFRLADETLSGMAAYGGFEPSVARAWCQVLQRSGRLFDAHVEAGMALREAGLNVAFRRDLLDIQAQCAQALDDWAQAAAKQAEILAAYAEQGEQAPYTHLWAHYEARIHAEDWDWILAHVEADRAAWGDDEVLQWARAAALAGTERTVEARDALLEPFAAVSLGGRSLQSTSLRLYPERRRAIALLAFRLFSALADNRAGLALDAMLGLDPQDAEALRLRADLALAQGRHEAAMADAFALLVPERRDMADFQRWYTAADRLSQQRHGATLAERATRRVTDALTLQLSSDEATFTAYKALGLQKPSGRSPMATDQLFLSVDPALTFAIVEDLVARDEVARARSELRKLSDAFPQVQEFRVRLGRLLVREGQFGYATDEFRRLLESVPGDTEALDLAIRSELALGEPQQAAAFVTRTILADPLGAGAVRYGQRLLDGGRAEQVQKLVERIVRWTEHDTRLDVLVLAARANLQLGRLDDTEAILASLVTTNPNSFDVALLGLDLGLERQQTGLVQASVAALRPVAPELFPDQLRQVATRLLDAGLHLELVAVFDDTVCALPAAQQSLRDVAQAHKALGQPQRADELLERLDDDADAVLDRFVLLCLQGLPDEAARRLRLRPSSDEGLKARADLCLLAANALMDLRSLNDVQPLERLSLLGAPGLLGEAQAELFDALLRLLPSLTRLQDVQPAAVVDDPLSAYPHAGADVRRLVELARSDPATARRTGQDLVHLLLMQDRPFWADESRLLAEHALTLLPGLAEPARTLARRHLEQGQPREALLLLQPLLLTDAPDPEDLRLFLEAARDFEHAEWGVALALYFEDQPQALRVLAEALADWGHPAESSQLLAKVLGQSPGDPRALQGQITVLSQLRRHDEVAGLVEQALVEHSEDRELAQACGDALAAPFRPSTRAVALMRFLWDRHPDLDQVGEALARAIADDEPLLREALERLAATAGRRAPLDDPERAATHSQALVRAARTARNSGHGELARAHHAAALRLEPGAINLYRELAFLELELGNLQEARSYLEVLSFVDTTDRDAALALAHLDFRQLGQPARAADIVRRTFTGVTPPDMVEILAAEAWLLGRPDDAINEFVKLSRSPLVSGDTYLTILRIAYAGGGADVARLVAGEALEDFAGDDPRRARVEFLLQKRLAR